MYIKDDLARRARLNCGFKLAAKFRRRALICCKRDTLARDHTIDERKGDRCAGKANGFNDFVESVTRYPGPARQTLYVGGIILHAHPGQANAQLPKRHRV